MWFGFVCQFTILHYHLLWIILNWISFFFKTYRFWSSQLDNSTCTSCYWRLKLCLLSIISDQNHPFYFFVNISFRIICVKSFQLFYCEFGIFLSFNLKSNAQNLSRFFFSLWTNFNRIDMNFFFFYYCIISCAKNVIL